MKWQVIHPGRGRYHFAPADAIANYARFNRLRLRGHVLAWHKQNPGWLARGNFSRDELIAILRDHIQTVVGRYRGVVSEWDVVNEAVEQDGSLRDTIWLRGIGPEYIPLAFRWAHEADPEARLFYNDLGAEGLGPQSDAVYRLVARLEEEGVPIDGVGLQAYPGVRGRPHLR